MCNVLGFLFYLFAYLSLGSAVIFLINRKLPWEDIDDMEKTCWTLIWPFILLYYTVVWWRKWIEASLEKLCEKNKEK